MRTFKVKTYYGVVVTFVVGTKEEGRRHAEKMGFRIRADYMDDAGAVFLDEGTTFLIWLSEEDIGYLVHEVVHLAVAVSKTYLDMRNLDEASEVLAYLTQDVVEKATKRLKNGRRRKHG
jgi:hypothetical protein